MSDSPNPYAVTTLELADTRTFTTSKLFTVTRWIVIVAQVAMVIAAVIAWIDIESIVVSGPIMLGVGLVVAVLSWWCKPCRSFGIACLIFPVVVFLIIFLLRWSPDDAQIPIGTLCTVFTLGMMGLVIVRDHEYRRAVEDARAEGFGHLTQESPTGDPLSGGTVDPAQRSATDNV